MLFRVRLNGTQLVEFDADVTPRVGEALSVAGNVYRIIQVEYAVVITSKPVNNLQAIILHVRKG